MACVGERDECHHRWPKDYIPNNKHKFNLCSELSKAMGMDFSKENNLNTKITNIQDYMKSKLGEKVMTLVLMVGDEEYIINLKKRMIEMIKKDLTPKGYDSKVC